MTERLFDEIRERSQNITHTDEDALIFQERSPLDEKLLEDIQAQLQELTGCTKKDRVRVTVLTTEQFQRALRTIVPKRLHDRGLAKNFRVLRDPRDPHHLFVGPSALSGLNEGHSTVVSDLIYQLISAQGQRTNQAFERGIADILAANISQQLGLPLFANIYPAEHRFVSTIIEAIRQTDEDPMELVALMKRSPTQFYTRVRQSGFYKWWEGSAKGNDQLSRYVDLISSITSPNAQLEGSFMQWAGQCAGIYCDYRAQQRKNALSGAKRSDN